MVFSTVAVASTAPPGQRSPSGVMGDSSVPPPMTPGDTFSEDFQVPMHLIREQREAATRLHASPLADLESICKNLAVATVTVPRRDSTVDRLRAEIDQLWGEVSRLTSEVGSFETVHNELKVSRRRLADRDVEIDCLRAALKSARNSIDNGPAGPDERS